MLGVAVRQEYKHIPKKRLTNPFKSLIRSTAIIAKRAFIFAAVLATSTSALSVLPFATTAYAAGGHQLSGKVSDQDGNSLQNVSITARAPGDTTVLFGPATTASDGIYSLAVDSGTYDIHFVPHVSSGLQPIVQNNVAISGNQTMNVQLTPTSPVRHAISGQITDRAGNPVEGLRVAFSNGSEFTGSFYTNATGHYSALISPGSWKVSISSDPYADPTPTLLPRSFTLTSTESVVDNTTGAANWSTQLDTVALTVQVQDANGNPARASVRAVASGNTTLATTDGQKTFNAVVGSYSIIRGNVNTNDSGTTTVYAFPGLTYPTGSGDPGAHGEAYAEPDNAQLCVSSGTTACIESPLTVSEDTTVNFTLPPQIVRHTISGQITDRAGKPVKGLRVEFFDGLTSAGGSYTNETGHYSAPALLGSWKVRVSSDPYAEATSAPLPRNFKLTSNEVVIDNTSGSTTWDIQLAVVTVASQVEDVSGNPAPYASVRAIASGSTQFTTSTGQKSFSAITGSVSIVSGALSANASGIAMVYTFPGLTYPTGAGDPTMPDEMTEYGDEQFCVSRVTTACLESPLTVSQDTNVSFTLPPQAVRHTISGQITDRAGNPVPNVQVQFLNGDAAGGGTYTNETGHYSASTLTGSWKVRISSDPFAASHPSPLPRTFELKSNETVVDNTTGAATWSMQLNTVDVSVNTKDSGGNPTPATVWAVATGSISQPTSSGQKTFDTVASTFSMIAGYMHTSSSGVATVYTFPGLTYPAGPGQWGDDYVSHGNEQLCVVYLFVTSCLSSPLTVSVNTAVVFQQSPPVTAAPSNLAIASPARHPALTWSSASGSSSYNVYRNGVKVASTADTNYADSDAPEGVVTYHVTAFNGTSESTASNSVEVLVDVTAPAVTDAVFSSNPKLTTDGNVTLTAQVADPLSNDSASGVAGAEYYNPVQDAWLPMVLSGSMASITINTQPAEYPAGSYGFKVRATDSAGNSSQIVMVELVIENPNQPPALGTLADVTITEGGVYDQTGTYSDVASSSWTGTVDYGDGSGVQSLQLSGGSFILSHVYPDEGVYTVTVSITDNQGATGVASAIVTVNNASASISAITASSNPIQVHASTTASATFTDPGPTDIHTAVWNWGDGTTSVANVTESNGLKTVSDSHIYTTAGVYVIALTITDNDGATSTQTFHYLSVYNPTPQGLFSGARLFTSPIGAYAANPLLTGKAMFGVTVKYDGSGQPTGKVKMSFDAANMDFVAESVDLLVTANGVATARGTGAFNGTAGYTFLVVGTDGQATGGQDVIRFQIKDSAGNVVYDTQPGAADIEVPTVQVAGQLIVH